VICHRSKPEALGSVPTQLPVKTTEYVKKLKKGHEMSKSGNRSRRLYTVWVSLDMTV